jgi:hypothetical protein
MSCTRALHSFSFDVFLPIWWAFMFDIHHHRKSACTIILSRKLSNACTLEHSRHLCKIRVAMVLDFSEVPRTLMQTTEFLIKLEGISTTFTTMLWTTKWWYVRQSYRWINPIIVQFCGWQADGKCTSVHSPSRNLSIDSLSRQVTLRRKSRI